jgi:hypothetical protein
MDMREHDNILAATHYEVLWVAKSVTTRLYIFKRIPELQKSRTMRIPRSAKVDGGATVDSGQEEMVEKSMRSEAEEWWM